MSFVKDFNPAPAIRPMLNIHPLIDVFTGDYFLGKHGESILNGGLANVTGIGGKGNTFKTVVFYFMILTAIARYKKAFGLGYDTELNGTMNRVYGLAKFIPGLEGVDLEDTGRFILTDKNKYSGNKIFEDIKEKLKEAAKRPKETTHLTPFLEKDGSYFRTPNPFIWGIDSLTEFSTDNVIAMQDDNEVGSSGRNMEAMRDGNAKTQLMRELPAIAAKYGMYVVMTAHIGEEYALDPKSPPKKKLVFLKSKEKIKGMPEKGTFLTGNFWYVISSSLMIHDDKTAKYPRDKDDRLEGDTDLMAITIMSLRNKSGVTGYPFDLVVSQKEGLKSGLTCFEFLKTFDRYGLSGNNINYHLDLMPDVALSRTVVRGKLDSDPKLLRAMELTTELCHAFYFRSGYPKGYFCTAKELYDDLKAKGYDWDRLLRTRGFHLPIDNDHPDPFLSGFDLLNMRAGTYHPYWYGPLEPVKTTQTAKAAA